MYYHSHEPRHVHYSPIEGAEIGIPVVLYSDNLVARMIGHPIAGAVESTEQARQMIISILEGDQDLVDTVRRDQRILSKLFSESYCLEVWKQNFAGSGLLAFLERPTSDALVITEDGAPAYQRVPRYLITEPRAVIDTLSTPEDGIDFRAANLPAFVEHVEGMSFPENWGAWSLGDSVEIELVEPISGRFDLEITGGAYGSNIGTRIKVEIGTVTKWMKFDTPAWEPTVTVIECHFLEPAIGIKIHIPYPTSPGPESAQKIGIGLQRIAIRKQRYADDTWWRRMSRGQLPRFDKAAS
jgi:hypothetical protein